MEPTKIEPATTKILSMVAITLGIITLVAFAGLIPLSDWRDEYYAFALQDKDFHGALARILQWSPRPLSEMIIYAYGQAVIHFGTPLTSKVIAPFWLLLVGAALWPVWRSGRGWLAASSLLSMLLLGHAVAEVFYWPFGVFAYLPTVMAAVAILSLDWGGWLQRRTGRAILTLALLIGAASSEVGAMFCAIYTIFCIFTIRRSSLLFATLLVLPLLLSSLILHAEYTGRVAQAAEIFGDLAIAHHPKQVLLDLAHQLFFQLLRGDDSLGPVLSLITGLATKLLFFGGIYFAMSGWGQPLNHELQRLRLGLVVAASMTAVLILAASLYNFGVVCCQRHDTMRQVYVFVALASLASFLAVRWPAKSRLMGPLLLIFALLIPLRPAVHKLRHDYRNYSAALLVRQANWASGHSAGPDMQLMQTYPGWIATGISIEPQTYRWTGQKKDIKDWILMYYKKQSMVIQPPIGSR